MPLVPLPEILSGVKFVYNSDKDQFELPEDATDEQRKAYEEHKKMVQQVQSERFVVED